VFTAPRGGPLHPTVLARVFGRWRLQVCAGIRLHDLRHTCASYGMWRHGELLVIHSHHVRLVIR
jgi:integrase